MVEEIDEASRAVAVGLNEVRIANRTPLPSASTHMPECASWTSC